MKTTSLLHKQFIEQSSLLAVMPKRASSWVVTNEAEALWVVCNSGFITAKTQKRIWPHETPLEVACRILKIAAPTCSVCGNVLQFSSLKSGWKTYFGDTCTKKCAIKHPEYFQFTSARAKSGSTNRKFPKSAWDEAARIKRRNTNIERYGHPTASSQTTLHKRKSTVLSKYGTENSFETELGIISRNKQKNNEKAKSLHNLLLKNTNFANVSWNGHNQISTWLCKRCNIQMVDVDTSPIKSLRCPECDPPLGSLIQHRLREDIQSAGIEVVYNTRKIIPPLELDLYLPQHQIAIEVNGLYWHSFSEQETASQRNASLHKWQRCREAGIQLLTFFEDELINKPDIVRQIVLAKCGKIKKIGARTLNPTAIPISKAREFLQQHHLHGHAPCKHAFALVDDSGSIFQVITVGASRFQRNRFELIRMVSKKEIQVIGGLSRLISFAKQELLVNEIVTYANRCISNGNTYSKLGKFECEVSPGYTWLKGTTRINRAKSRRSALPLLLGTSFDETKTEAVNMFHSGWRRIWDCGHLRYVL